MEAGWIERRTGIRCRPIADNAIATSDLAIDAGERVLRAACVNASEVGLLLLATSTPDHLLSPTAPLVAHRLSLTHAGAIDLTGACSGFLYGVGLGSSYGQTIERSVLVIAANILSRRVNQSDPGTVALFGDGANAYAVWLRNWSATSNLLNAVCAFRTDTRTSRAIVSERACASFSVAL